jgi:2'-5' RNA ligase
MSINFPPVQELYLDFKRSYRKKLKNRGEAHVTTITPVEYFQVLKDKVSIEEINDIALDHRIQESDLNIICLGSGHKGNLDTFFVVVESQNLLKIRKAVDELFEARGGNPRAFSPEDFYPHITLGFNKRDLHESDGVIKDGSSCIYNIVVQ